MSFRRIARFATARLLPSDDREFILGDLDEMYRKWSVEEGRATAARRYIGASLASVVAQWWPRFAPGGDGPRRDRPSSHFDAGLLADLRDATRLFRHRPGFVLVVALTLGLGVGSVGAVFSMANQLLLRPPPGVANLRDIAVLRFHTSDRDYVGISGPDMVALREATTLLDGFASTDTLPTAAYASAGESRPVAVNAFAVYGDYFELLGVRPLLGRLLAADETGPEANPLVAVISEVLWERLFARSPDAIGSQLQMGGRRLTVIGVAGGGFRGTAGSGWLVDVWTPRSAYALLDGYPLERLWSRDSTLNQDFVVRLQHGVTLEAVEQQLNAIIGRLAEADPEHREFLSDLRATLTPGLDSPRVRERMLSTLGAFGGAALLVLLIACANVANLLLVRALQARNELAVRRALGASAARVARRQLVESALLAAAGTIVGLAFAWSVGWMFRGDPFLDFQGLVVDARLLGFAIVAATGTTMLFGAMPAVLAGRFNLDAALRGAARGTTRRDSFARHALSALQIGLSLMLLIGGVLLIRTVRNLYAMEPGIEVENVSTVLIDFGAETPDDESLGVLYRELPKAVSTVPGVQVAAVDGWYGPYRGRPTMAIATLDAPEDATETADMRRVTPDWFAVMGLDPLVGRTLDDSDARPSSPPVVVLTSRLAQRLFDSTNVIGRYVRVGRTPVEAEIVGVVGDIRIADVRSEPDEAVFLPLITENMGPVALLARTSAVSPPAPAAIREAVEAMIPNIAVPEPTPLTERIDVQLAEQRVFMRLLGLLSALALVLAAIGLYGVVAFTVAGRKREFGIRMALGADGTRVAGLVSWTAAKIVGSGTILGLAGAYSLSGVIESKLFGVEAVDLASYAAAAALLAAVAVVASGVPALGAARVDPADTLRQE